MEPPAPNETSDFATLISRASAGDAEAQELLCRQYEPQVRIVARVMLGAALRPYVDTVDIMQTVHRSLLFGLRHQRFEIRSHDNLVALASTMVRRKIAREWRRHRRQRRLESPNWTSEHMTLALSSLLSREPNPHESAQLKDALHRMYRNMRELDRQLLRLKLDGHTGAEISETLRIHPVAMRVRLSRLRQHLKGLGLEADFL